MMNEAHRATSSTVDERRQRLIAQGASYRTGIVHAKNCAVAGLRPAALAKGLIGHIVSAAATALKAGNAAAGTAPSASGPGLDLQAMLPLLASGMAALSKTSLPKPVTRGAAILGVAGAVAVALLKKRAARKAAARTAAPDAAA
jgi:hypothetical protein